MNNDTRSDYSIVTFLLHGVGATVNAVAHAAMQTPCAQLQAKIAAGTAAPPVDTPATPPAAATHATQTALHPLMHTL